MAQQKNSLKKVGRMMNRQIQAYVLRAKAIRHEAHEDHTNNGSANHNGHCQRNVLRCDGEEA